MSFTRSITREVSRTGPIRDFNVFRGELRSGLSSLSFLDLYFSLFFSIFTPLEKKRLSKKMTPEFHIKFLVIWPCVIHCCMYIRSWFRMTVTRSRNLLTVFVILFKHHIFYLSYKQSVVCMCILKTVVISPFVDRLSR